MDALSNGPPLSPYHEAAVTLIRADHRTHSATEEAARTLLGFLRLTKGGHASSDADRVFAELANQRLCRPRPTAVSGPLNTLRLAFVDRTLVVSLHAANKAAASAAFAKITPDKPPCADAETRKAAADGRKATVARAAVAARTPPSTKPGYPSRPPPKK
jgi:hypothetical protein